MVKAIVLYNSHTGNTKKVAEKIAEGLGVESRDKKNIPDLQDFDLVALGSWVIMGRISFGGARYLRRIRKKLAGKKVALFFTSAGPDEDHWKKEDGSKPRKIKDVMFKQMERIVNKHGNVSILSERFYCKGYIKFGGQEDNIGHPTDEDLEKAKEFGGQLRQILET